MSKFTAQFGDDFCIHQGATLVVVERPDCLDHVRSTIEQTHADIIVLAVANGSSAGMDEQELQARENELYTAVTDIFNARGRYFHLLLAHDADPGRAAMRVASRLHAERVVFAPALSA